jgi:hypothetical protein
MGLSRWQRWPSTGREAFQGEWLYARYAKIGLPSRGSASPPSSTAGIQICYCTPPPHRRAVFRDPNTTEVEFNGSIRGSAKATLGCRGVASRSRLTDSGVL